MAPRTKFKHPDFNLKLAKHLKQQGWSWAKLGKFFDMPRSSVRSHFTAEQRRAYFQEYNRKRKDKECSTSPS